MFAHACLLVHKLHIKSIRVCEFCAGFFFGFACEHEHTDTGAHTLQSVLCERQSKTVLEYVHVVACVRSDYGQVHVTYHYKVLGTHRREHIVHHRHMRVAVHGRKPARYVDASKLASAAHVHITDGTG